ncbi:MAG: hypothetical protein KKI08_18050 [Armatimonadetes bacterium]|nr:hypothetical protein [Armatimonadota bacterium]
MASETDLPRAPWWKLQRLEQVALLLGALISLGAAAPLVWLSAEAQRIGHMELTAASHLYPRALLLVWLGGAVVGGLLAAKLARGVSRAAAGRGGVLGHALRLAGGAWLIAVLSPLPVALVALAVTRQPDTFSLYYVSSGGAVGWQPGVISFVFLYTFRVLEQRKNDNDCRGWASTGSASREAGAPRNDNDCRGWASTGSASREAGAPRNDNDCRLEAGAPTEEP